MKTRFIIVAYVMCAAVFAILIAIKKDKLFGDADSTTANIIYGVIAFAVAVVLVIIANSRQNDKEPVSPSEDDDTPARMEELIEQYGEPSDIIVTNPLRADSPSGCVLVYNSEGFFIINGIRVEKGEITDITFCNAAVAYTPSDYQVLVYVRKYGQDKQKIIRIYTGDDLTQAREVALAIKKHLLKRPTDIQS